MLRHGVYDQLTAKALMNGRKFFISHEASATQLDGGLEFKLAVHGDVLKKEPGFYFFSSSGVCFLVLSACRLVSSQQPSPSLELGVNRAFISISVCFT